MSGRRAELLAGASLEAALLRLPGWVCRESAAGGVAGLHRAFAFASFSAAWGWMSRVALLAEARDHHPEWSNVYSRVDVRLTSHDAGGITARDVEMAERLDEFFAAAAAAPPPLR